MPAYFYILRLKSGALYIDAVDSSSIRNQKKGEKLIPPFYYS